MVLTVTINPLLERRFIYDKIELGKVNRTGKEYFAAGGKGINVSRQLNKLGIKNLSLTFLGGNNGKILRRLLSEEEINFTAVSTKESTRCASIIEEHGSAKVTSFFGRNPIISKKEIEEFKSRLEKAIGNASIVVFSGSSPSQEANEILTYGIELANKYDKISILDTYGNHLENCLNAAPTIIHNNKEEIENSLNVKLDTEKDFMELMELLYKKNIKMSFITNGNKTAYASKFDFNYKVTPQKIKAKDATGSGDSFTAGIIYGIEKSFVFEDFLKLGISMGTSNAETLEVCNLEKEMAFKYVDCTEVYPIGKKMKLIDDTPNY